MARGNGASAEARARALIGAATLHRWRGDLTPAVGCARESVALRRQLDDQAALAESLLVLAGMLGPLDPTAALPLAEQGATIRGQRGDAIGTASALYDLGNINSYA